jgi:hypothetical protein
VGANIVIMSKKIEIAFPYIWNVGHQRCDCAQHHGIFRRESSPFDCSFWWHVFCPPRQFHPVVRRIWYMVYHQLTYLIGVQQLFAMFAVLLGKSQVEVENFVLLW